MATEKKELTAAKKKKVIPGCIAIIIIVLGIIIAVSTCSGDAENTTTPNVLANELAQQKSDSLYNYLLSNINIQEGMTIEVNELTDNTCRIYAVVPKELGASSADVVGTGVCMLAVKWLDKNGYDLKTPGVMIASCSVHSPHTGVTGRTDLIMVWGKARYDPFSDNINWEWKKAK